GALADAQAPRFAPGPPRLRRRFARAHRCRRDDLPRAESAPSAPARRPAGRRRPRPRYRAYAGARTRPELPADARGPPARPRPSRPAGDRGPRVSARGGGPGRVAPRRRRAPRRAGGEDSRGRLPLPREPARCGRSHPSRRRQVAGRRPVRSISVWEGAAVRLEGRQVVVEPLSPGHEQGLYAAAVESDWSLMQYNASRSPEVFHAWLEDALDRTRAGLEVAFATIDHQSGRPIGSTRYLALRREHRGLEIGWTWLARSAWG